MKQSHKEMVSASREAERPGSASALRLLYSTVVEYIRYGAQSNESALESRLVSTVF